MAVELYNYRTRLRSLDDTPAAAPAEGQAPVYRASTDSFVWASQFDSFARACSPVGDPVAWDTFSRDDSPSPGSTGQLGTSDSGHAWIDVTEPTGGWGVDRPRYYQILDNAAVPFNSINAGFACAVVEDERFTLEERQGLVASLTMFSGPRDGHVIRYIDENNWIACRSSSSGRGLEIFQCKGGATLALTENATILHTNVSNYGPIELRAGIVIPISGYLWVWCVAIGFGRAVGIDYRIEEAADPSWYAALAGATKAGITGGQSEKARVRGYAIGRV